MQPPIAPIGLDYVAEALVSAGHTIDLLDLCWEQDARAAIARFLTGSRHRLIGVTLRNTDDCSFTSRWTFLPEFAELVQTIRGQSDALVVLGGVGFSVMPEQIMQLSGAHAGIWGEGEFVFPELAARLERGEDWRGLPNLIWLQDGRLRRNPGSTWPLEDLPPMSRGWVDNPRYFREGGQAGFETKRGCSSPCVYCADPVAKGRQIRTRPPRAVADELARLLDQGIDHLHTCDAEFNLPERHAAQICREFVRRGFGEKLRWYAYCSPAPFSRALAGQMRAAGCVGVNFGADSGDSEILKRLRRGFTPDDILNAARWSKEAGMAVMLDLLLGSPGESCESLTRTVELMKQAEPDHAGVSVGVRVYPGTEFASRPLAGRPGASGAEALLDYERQHGRSSVTEETHGDFTEPLYYIEPDVAPFIFELLDALIGDDERFFFFDPSRPERNYNYNANQRLTEAIRNGHRGAYWDILGKVRKQQDRSPQRNSR